MRKEVAMTTIEKLNAIPKVVYVTREQLGAPALGIHFNEYGLAEFILDLKIHDEGVNLSYQHSTFDEIYDLWDGQLQRMTTTARN